MQNYEVPIKMEVTYGLSGDKNIYSAMKKTEYPDKDLELQSFDTSRIHSSRKPLTEFVPMVEKFSFQDSTSLLYKLLMFILVIYLLVLIYHAVF